MIFPLSVKAALSLNENQNKSFSFSMCNPPFFDPEENDNVQCIIHFIVLGVKSRKNERLEIWGKKRRKRERFEKSK